MILLLGLPISIVQICAQIWLGKIITRFMNGGQRRGAGKKGANFQTFDMPPPSSDSTDLVANLPSIQADCNASSHLDCMDAYYI
ncbi:hypothetical protein KY285_026909 [Solanum tuberosum]|nr:hypothetical protein KY285_026909 [Solanum tuberosum]